MTDRILVSFRVDAGLWVRVRQRCVGNREPVTAVLERLLVEWMSNPMLPRETFSMDPFLRSGESARTVPVGTPVARVPSHVRASYREDGTVRELTVEPEEGS